MSNTTWGNGKHEVQVCSLCGQQFAGMGNNPEPLLPFDKRCCDECNQTKVIPARLERRRGTYN